MRNESLDSTHRREMFDLEVLGRIILLQVQVRSLKRGERPRRWYDPDPLTSVPGIRIDPGGVTGIDGDGEPTIWDVHHRDHPDSRFRGENGVSIGFTSHYRRMRDRFGDHVRTGIAGENIIVETDDIQEEGDLAPGMVIRSGQGPVRLGAVECVKPCAEFTKWCLRYPHDRLPDAAVTDALKFLFSGTRGFLATIEQRTEQRIDGTLPLHPGRMAYEQRIEQDAPQWPRIAVGDFVYRRRATA